MPYTLFLEIPEKDMLEKNQELKKKVGSIINACSNLCTIVNNMHIAF